MGLARNQLSIESVEGGRYVVRSAVPVDLANVAQTDRDTVVFADRITVDGEVRTEGFSLTLVCREISFGLGSQINSSGKPAARNFPAGLPKEGSHDAGAPGGDGDNGGDGADGGAVFIAAMQIVGQVNIKSNGGPGGRGQDGGNGRQGPQGTPGQDVDSNDHARRAIPRESIGGKGGTGGPAGLPGTPGSGGKGGKIELFFVSPPAVEPELAISGGQPGEPAAGGKPGSGGPPGTEGKIFYPYCYLEPITFLQQLEIESHIGIADAERSLAPLGFISLNEGDKSSTETDFDATLLLHAAASYARPSRRTCEQTFGQYGGNYGQGDQGDERKGEIVQRQTQPAIRHGSRLIQTIQAASLASRFDDIFLEILAYGIEDEYCSKGLAIDDELRARIEFLLVMCSDDSPNPGSQKKELLARAYAMARKVSLGLDFFGYTIERTPLLSFEAYADIIRTTVLPQATQIEQSFNSYWDASQTQEGKRQAIRESTSAARLGVSNLDIEVARSREEARQLLSDIPALDRKVESAYTLLMTREKELTAAIRSKNNQCDLLGTLVAVGTIVAGVSSGGAGFIAAAGAAKKLYSDYDAHNGSLAELWDNKKLLQDDFQEIAKDAKTFTDSVKSIQEAVKKLSPEQLRLPQFRMERSKFDEVAKQFADIPAAAKYKEAGYDYLKCVETRNQSIVDYNAALVQLIEFQAKSDAAKRIVDKFASLLARAFDPSEAIVVSLMSRLYIDTLSLAAQMVHSEKKALAYHFARPADAPLSKLNVATITSAHQKVVLQDWVSAKERFRVKRLLADGLLTLSLQDMVAKEAWTAFQKTGLLAFTIRRDHPKYVAVLEALPGLRLTGLSLSLKGAKTATGQTQIPWLLTQGGLETIYSADGTSFSFSHRSIPVRGFTPVAGGKSLIQPDFSELNVLAGISPYASWLLALSRNSTLGLDLTGLKEAELQLYGYMLEG